MASRATIKIFGERNSGTNYLQQLFTLNLDVDLLRGEAPRVLTRTVGAREWPRDVYFRLTRQRNLGWKHSSPSYDPVARAARSRGVSVVTMAKNPYAWLLSMHRRPYHYIGSTGTFAEFLSRPWVTVGRDNHDAPYLSPITMWNEKNGSYLALRECARCVNLRYEDVLADPVAAVARLAASWDIALRNGAITNVDKSTKSDASTFDTYQDYYLNERWRSELDTATLQLINTHLDAEVVERLGYSLVTAS